MKRVVVYPPGLRGIARTPSGWCSCERAGALASESVDGSSLALEGVDDVEGGDGLAAGVLGVGDRVADDGLQERLEYSTGLLVDESGDSLDSSAAGETADGRLGDSLDVVAKDFSVALGSSLAETLSSLATSGHLDACFLEFFEKCCLLQIQGYLSSINEPTCLVQNSQVSGFVCCGGIDPGS